MEQAQPYKTTRDDKVKAPPSRLTFVTKTDNPYQAQQKSANIEENTKNRGKTDKYTVKCAPTTEIKHSNQSSKNRGATTQEADKNNNR